jgi:DNA-binding response OmpR family regulator
VLPLQRERLLVVEDEPTVAQLIADVLAGEGHIVDTVLDSQQGLDRALKGEYDLVICDLKMPHLDGRAFYRELLRKDSPMQSRVIFVTGDTLAARTMDFLESSGVPYLAKPFLVEALKSVVAQALANPMHSGGNPSLRVLGRASQGRQ